VCFGGIVQNDDSDSQVSFQLTADLLDSSPALVIPIDKKELSTRYFDAVHQRLAGKMVVDHGWSRTESPYTKNGHYELGGIGQIEANKFSGLESQGEQILRVAVALGVQFFPGIATLSRPNGFFVVGHSQCGLFKVRPEGNFVFPYCMASVITTRRMDLLYIPASIILLSLDLMFHMERISLAM
jgi:hypothetical protein